MSRRTRCIRGIRDNEERLRLIVEEEGTAGERGTYQGIRDNEKRLRLLVIDEEESVQVLCKPLYVMAAFQVLLLGDIMIKIKERKKETSTPELSAFTIQRIPTANTQVGKRGLNTSIPAYTWFNILGVYWSRT